MVIVEIHGRHRASGPEREPGSCRGSCSLLAFAVLFTLYMLLQHIYRADDFHTRRLDDKNRPIADDASWIRILAA